MPRVVLTRALTYFYKHQGKGYHFRRGEIVEVPEIVYHNVIRLGGFSDPDQTVDYVHPRVLKTVPAGTEVPVIRDMGLGDVLMASIPLRDLVGRHPRLKFIYAVDSRYVGLFKNLDFGLYKICAIARLRGAFQWGLDLRGLVERSPLARKMDRIDVFADYMLGGPPQSYRYPLQPTEEWKQRGRAIIGAMANRPTVGLVYRASMANRSWGDDYLREFCQMATADGWRVVMLHPKPLHPGFFEHPLYVDLSGRINVEELKWVTSAVDVVVSPDTGTAHLAEAVQTKCVAFYTTVPPERRVGHYHWMRVLYPEGKLPCLGCTHSPRCRPGDPRPCALMTTPEMVWQQVQWAHEHEPPWAVFPYRGELERDEPEQFDFSTHQHSQIGVA